MTNEQQSERIPIDADRPVDLSTYTPRRPIWIRHDHRTNIGNIGNVDSVAPRSQSAHNVPDQVWVEGSLEPS